MIIRNKTTIDLGLRIWYNAGGGFFYNGYFDD